MILDHVRNWQSYAACHPAFPQAFEYLCETDFSQLEAGRFELDGNRVYAMLQDCEGRGKDGARLEAHRRYIDIQFTFAGEELIGWGDIADVAGEGYDEEKDVEFATGKVTTWVDVPAGHFAVFFPQDAHAPLAATGKFRKVVVKIAVE